MKEKYLDAELEIILLDESDIITTSDETGDTGDSSPGSWGDFDDNAWT